MQSDTDITIIGGGPRGLAVLEALALRGQRRKLAITLVDDVEPGAGRIWRTTQPGNLLMNTLASQVTIFSAEQEGSGVSNGPSLLEWLNGRDGQRADFYASRQVYGQYLKFALARIVGWLEQAGTSVTVLTDRVEDAEPHRGGYTLRLASGGVRFSRQVVLCTGHSGYDRPPVPQEDSAASIRYMPGDSCADLPLEQIGANEQVALLGLGLGFLDIVSSLTEGRGGRFRRVLGGMQYQPSGREPQIFAGSRTGLPIPGRAINQKNDYRHQALFFSPQYLQALPTSARLDFSVHLLPLIVAEMEHVYYFRHVENIRGAEEALQFGRAHLAQRDPFKPFDRALLEPFELGLIEPFDLGLLKNPFQGRTYLVHADFNVECSFYLERDLKSAYAGNLTSPLKSALDVLRDIRDSLRDQVEFEGLSLDSWHQFASEFSATAALLAAGPPIERIEQLLSLIKAGVVTLIGPGMAVQQAGEHFHISSPAVRQAPLEVRWLVDSRTPFPPLLQTANGLLKAMVGRGLLVPYRDARGGISVEQGSYRVVNGLGGSGLYALGIPTEGPKWFTQVGSATPGKRSNFTREAGQLVDALLAEYAQESVA